MNPGTSVRGVHHEQVDALPAHAGEGAQVGEAAVQQQLIHLEVTRDGDVLPASVHEDRERVGDQEGDGDELESKGPTVRRSPGDDVEVGVGQAVFAQLGSHESARAASEP